MNNLFLYSCFPYKLFLIYKWSIYNWFGIHKEINGLFVKIGGRESRNSGKIFESLCIKYGISNREKEIIKLILKGLLNKEIAFKLHLSKRAVEYHITNIYRKVGISKRYDLLSRFRI